MNWKLLLAGSVVLTLNSGYVLGMTRVVPSDAPTIQHGIWESAAGDAVLVMPGTYVENILINKDIVVRSADGPAVTVIDGGAPANGLYQQK